MRLRNVQNIAGVNHSCCCAIAEILWSRSRLLEISKFKKSETATLSELGNTRYTIFSSFVSLTKNCMRCNIFKLHLNCSTFQFDVYITYFDNLYTFDAGYSFFCNSRNLHIHMKSQRKNLINCFRYFSDLLAL